LKLIGYHGTNNKNLKNINNINIDYNRGDCFLGKGFYLFRDSFKRAKKWTNYRNYDEKYVLEVLVDVDEKNLLNFCTTADDEIILKFFRLYEKLCKEFNIYLGTFIDFLLEEMNIDIKVVMAIDLREKNKHIFFPIEKGEENSTVFAIGDIQICIKDKNAIEKINLKEINGK